MVATSTKASPPPAPPPDRKARTPEFRRAEEDILILNGLGAYYANLFRAALFYSIHQQTGDTAASAQLLVVTAEHAMRGPHSPPARKPSTPQTSATDQPHSAAVTGPTACP